MEPGSTALPTGVVTFLFTDVEGSTALWDAHPDGMRTALEVHDALIEAAVLDAGGTLLKSRGEGDSTFSVFERPTAAVTAALEARRALERADWPDGCRIEARFAVHMGEVSERDGDYYGPAVNRAARLRGLAVGGQVLVSQAVTEVVSDHLPEDASLLDLGEQELRGLSRPERVWALVDAFRPVREALGGLCPYKGLLAFQPEDSDVFFGREPLVAALLGRILDRYLLVVVGASGSGKSSLARAGVVGSLRRGALPGSERWPTVIVTPGEHPSARLAAELAALPGPSLHADDQLPTDARARAAMWRDAAGEDRIVVVIDQMEELFTSCRDAKERERFVEMLLDATEHLDGRVLVVCALRADFYGHCAGIPRLADAVSESTQLLGPMDERELTRAIEAPAEVAGLQLEPGLVDLMLRDLAHEPGSLPLLSHALLETWHRRTNRTLTILGYQESGGVRGAIAHTAETVWNQQLTPEERVVARRIFLRLTELGEGTEDTRRRVTRAELVSGGDADAADRVLASLVDARLVTVGDGTAEVAHEALIREWPRLRGWLDDDREGLRVHRHLTHAAAGWESVGRDPAELYRGPRLAAAREWLAADPDAALNELESEFVAASTELEDEERAAEEERAAARERANRRLRRLLIGTAAALVVAIVAVFAALNQRNRADDQADRALTASVSAEVDRIVAEVPTLMERDRTLAALLAAEATRVRPDAASQGALLEALTAEPQWRATYHGGHAGYAWSAMFPDRRRAVIAGRDGLDVWDLESGRVLRSAEARNTSGVSVNADGTLVASGTRQGTVVIRDARTLRPEGRPLDVGEPVTGVAFDPDGGTVAVSVGSVSVGSLAEIEPATPDNAARLWDVETRRVVGSPLDGHRGTVNALAYSPDGRLLATGGNDGLVVFHDATTGVSEGAPLSLGREIYSLSFTPDGGRMGVATVEGVAMFAVASRAPIGPELSASGPLPQIAFSPDGARVAVTGEFAQVRDATTLEPIGAAIDTQRGRPLALFARDGGLLLSGFDGTLSRWDPDGSPMIARAIPGAPTAGGVFSPDGTRLAAAGSDDTVALYRVRDSSRIATLSAGTPGPRPLLGGATPVAFSGDGRRLALADRFGTMQLFDGRSGRAIGEPVATGLTTGISGLVFAPDQRVIAAAGNLEALDGLRIVDVATGTVQSLRPPFPYTLSTAFRPDGRRLLVTAGVGGASAYPISGQTFGTGRQVAALGAEAEFVTFSPDRRLLAVGTTDGKVQFHDAVTLAVRGAPVAVSNGLIATLAFSDDGERLIAQDTGLQFRLIDVPGRASIGDALPTGGAGYGVAGFSPGGRRVALPGSAGTTVWDLDVPTWRRDACTLAGRSLTRAEWERYLSAGGEYRRTCPG